MKRIFTSLVFILVFSLSVNIAKADTLVITYRDGGCPNQYVPGGPNVDCTTPGSFSIGGGCPPGTVGAGCQPSTNWISGSDNTLRLTHTVTFNTDKEEYRIGETIIPVFNSTSLSVVCPARYTKTISADMNVSNLRAYIRTESGGYYLADTRWSSPIWVNSFTVDKAGDYFFAAKNIQRNPLTYTNDCNEAGDFNISYGAYGLDIIDSNFTVLENSIIPSIYIR